LSLYRPDAGQENAVDAAKFDVDFQTQVGDGLRRRFVHVLRLNALRRHAEHYVAHALHFRCHTKHDKSEAEEKLTRQRNEMVMEIVQQIGYKSSRVEKI